MIANLWRRARGEQTELLGLAGDSFFASLWQGASTVADLVQIVLITHVLGLSDYGRFALVVSFVVLVGQFFDVRVGIAAVTQVTPRLAEGDPAGAAAVLRLSYQIDAVTGFAAFAIVVGLAPLLGPHLVGSHGALYIALFALTLLASTVDDTSVAILRVFDRFGLLAGYTGILEALRVAFVGVALLVHTSLTAVFIALVVYYALRSAVNLSVALRTFVVATATSMWRAGTMTRDLRRKMIRTTVHTNLVSYSRIAQVQLPTLLLGSLTTVQQVGLYKIGTAAGAMIGRLADPAYAAVLPRLSRLWGNRQHADIRRLIRSASVVATVALGTALLVLVALRDPVLRLLAGDAGRAAATVLVLTAVAQAVNGVLFWNTGLLFAAGRSATVSLIAVSSTVLQLALVIPFVSEWRSTGAAAALLTSVVLSNLVITVFALRLLNQGDRQSEEMSSDHRATATESEYAPRM